jgi:sensor domain CHASE-containing protein
MLSMPADHAARDSQPGVLHGLIAVAVCVATIIGGTLIINLQAREIEARNKVDLLVLGSALQARLSRELNSVLFLSSGLSSYLAVRRASLDRAEVESILEALHRDSRHVRNFAVAVGYRITYIYPVKGNEKAVGLNYSDAPVQWPDVKRAIDTGRPVLTGPLALVQGGSGLIYRVPIFAGGKYWGLLSSVIDTKSLLNSALSDTAADGIAIAIRGTNGQGAGRGIPRRCRAVRRQQCATDRRRRTRRQMGDRAAPD